MDLETELKKILFNIGKEVKIHKLIDGNLILDIDYDKYAIQIIKLFQDLLNE